MKLTTAKGYGFFEATSAFQKAIRRGDETQALYWMVEFYNSGYDGYLWKRMKIITSEDVGLAEPTMPATIQALFQSYNELKKEEDARVKSKGESNRPERMFLTHAVLLLCHCKKSRFVDWALIKIWREHDHVKMEIPDWAYDMHNTKGKSMGRGLDHFYKEGTELVNHFILPGEEMMRLKAKQLHEKYPGKLKFTADKRGNLSEQKGMFEGE